eukprot:6102237-Prymnesium_polylepis.1
MLGALSAHAIWRRGRRVACCRTAPGRLQTRSRAHSPRGTLRVVRGLTWRHQLEGLELWRRVPVEVEDAVPVEAALEAVPLVLGAQVRKVGVGKPVGRRAGLRHLSPQRARETVRGSAATLLEHGVGVVWRHASSPAGRTRRQLGSATPST